MKKRLADLIRCPACLARLALHVTREEDDTSGLAPASGRCSTLCVAHHQLLSSGSAPQTRKSCRECYGREVLEGFFACTSCHLLYPIIAGVPRLIRNAYEEHEPFFHRHRQLIADLDGQEALLKRMGRVSAAVFDKRSNESFSLQWEMHRPGDHTWFKNDADLRRQEFLYSMDLREDELKGRLILDAGCGNGSLTASITRYGAEVVGLDLSSSIEGAYQSRFRFANGQAPFVHYVQGNILEPPFAPETFDHIHTTGVLHHTPSTENAFRSFLELGKPGGRVYVQLYRRREAWVRITNQMLRAVTTKLPVRTLYQLCYAMVPVHTALVRLVARARGEATPIAQFSRRERAISMFDHFSPKYQYRYTPDQVREMFEREGLTAVKDVTLANEARHMVAFVGDKRATTCVESAAS
jgi:2-polyprenyl-3-methyl-5-hydroxy-6-metoxy-1,4-benzoquinol methylase/uncharacterized protein YbaR (Trm112 family)